VNAQQLGWMTAVYFVAFVAVVYFTRATVRRVVGAVVGGTVAAAMLLGVMVLAEKFEWWHVFLAPEPASLALLYICAAISWAPIYLLTWRVARRFGLRGLMVFFLVAAIIGPPRDYLVAALYPEWIAFGAGISPILAVAATYCCLVALGHWVMSIVAGPSKADRRR
jgi:hypothetical protein